MMRTEKAYISDLLDSIKRLNEECSQRVEFEKKLMDVIKKQDETIDSLKQYCDNYLAKINTMTEQKEKDDEEVLNFKNQVEKMFLKKNEHFIWNNGKLEVYEDNV